jgi:glycosyltransferase involved in cell wall biosynthesis
MVKNEFGVKTKFMIVMVATFSTFKDYDLFADSAREMAKIRNDVTFVGVGDGPEWPHIKSRIVNEGINNIILTGKQKQVERIIAASDIGLLCTKSEGISNSIIEYMAMGKPAISTDLSGGSRELICHGKTGYCIDRDVHKIVRLSSTLLDNPELRISMGNKARSRIRNEFSINRMAEEFQNLYQGVASGKSDSVLADLKNAV